MPCESFDRVVDGQRITGVICSDRRRRRCAFCQAWSTVLCDGPPPTGSRRKSCDTPCCPAHATHLAGQNIDYCPKHAAEATRHVQLEFGLGS